MLYKPHKIFNHLRKIFSFYCSLRTRVSASYWGVNLEGNITVIGKLVFYKKPNTNIIIGKGCRFNSSPTSNFIGVNRPCMISTLSEGSSIKIGKNSGFSGTVIGGFLSIEIGENVHCGANTLITDSDWHLNDYRSEVPKKVILEDNVWLGEGAKVLKGVTIGKNSVIGAGSIVTKSIPSNVIAAGNPCKVLKEIAIKKNNDLN